jgi:osmotically-inducible protein OsmY
MNRVFSLRRVAGVMAATAAFALVGCSSTRYERSVGEFVDDKVLDRRVDHALNAQPVYKYPDVHVHSYRGTVQLSGFVATEAQKQAATEIAQRVRGVAQVENAISIAPLGDMTLKNFIPGRPNDTNEVNRTATGAPARNVEVQRSGPITSGSVTNDNTRRDVNVNVNR